MGFFDRVKQLFTGDADEDKDAPSAEASARAANVKESGERRRDRPDRPPLVDAPPPSQTIEDVLAERAAGRNEEARKILREIDRGQGLRTVLRAAAAIEANDDDELRELLPRVAREEPRWRLDLQVAGALRDPEEAKPLIERAAAEGAPAWALAWSRATSDDEKERREGLVELLFADHALARTVAARDLNVPGAAAEGDAAARYAAFAHGRDSIRRFGAAVVADVLRRARGEGGAGAP